MFRDPEKELEAVVEEEVKVPAMEAKVAPTSNPPSKEALELTSKKPEMRRSLVAERPRFVVPVPNLEYAALAYPPTCKVLPVKK